MELKLFKTREEAKKEAEKLGCKGTHIHREEGKKKFMPCSTHKQYEKQLNKDEESKEEIEELVDFDGTMNNSKIPILRPSYKCTWFKYYGQKSRCRTPNTRPTNERL
jgi:hypothetical protein